ncbi:hypothetical protein GF386_03020 [Candidatus Pacearchaeota archaeon]|nr:hypothetical protein [Candidatus Pacearchaeota archaeon]MBD3283111.1 hypothetical protein [Candidatus Pacearchaeota archaeon]
MKRSVDFYFLEKKKIIILLVVVLLIIFMSVVIYFSFMATEKCENMDCFYKSLRGCEKATWIKEDKRASWFYRILRESDSFDCEVEVTLVKIKQGKLDLEKLENKKMICYVSKNSAGLPEGDLSKCTGSLREELQAILLERMHDYIVQNIGEIKKEFF